MRTSQNTRFPASAILAFLVIFYIIHSLDSTAKTLIIILLLSQCYGDFSNLVAVLRDKVAVFTGEIPPYALDDSSTSTVEDSVENMSGKYNQTITGTPDELSAQRSHKEDVTKEDVIKHDFIKQDDSVLKMFENVSLSLQGKVLCHPGKSENYISPELTDVCSEKQEDGHVITLSSDHTQLKSFVHDSLEMETTRSSEHGTSQDVDLVSLESDVVFLTESFLDLRSSPLDEEEEDVHQPPEASTNQHQFSNVLKLYDAINKHLHELSFIQGCMIRNEMLQVLISDSSDLDICKNYILNVIDFDFPPEMLLVDYVYCK